jgi:hypothetical protein
MTLEVPTIVILITLEVPTIVILVTLENIYSTGITYDRQNIFIVQDTGAIIELCQTIFFILIQFSHILIYSILYIEIGW